MFNWVKKAVSELCIASPHASQDLIWRWPDQNIPHGAKLTVRVDETVVLFKGGRYLAQLDAGEYIISSQNLPILGNMFVSPLTGGNHYLVELFFVRRTEYIQHITSKSVGIFSDLESRLQVGLFFNSKFSVRITDPNLVITTITGQRTNGQEIFSELLESRMAAIVASFLGNISTEMPILNITNGQWNERIGSQIRQSANMELSSSGIEVVRFIDLQIMPDEQSLNDLRNFSRKRAAISLEREEADLARDPAYAQYQQIKGQRVLMDGLAAGAAQGGRINIPAPMLPIAPMPIAAPLQSAAISNPLLPQAQITRAPRWYLRTNAGIEGPYLAKPFALRAHACGFNLSADVARMEGLSSWQAIQEFSPLVEALSALSPIPNKPQSNQSFEQAFTHATSSGVLNIDALKSLTVLACQTGISKTPEQAKDMILWRAKAIGCVPAENNASTADTILAQNAPPPLPTISYVYSNGIERISGLTLAAIQARIQALPDGVHMVWRPGMPQWVPATDIIKA